VSVAGVRLDGAFLWVEAGDHQLDPLTRVEVEVDGTIQSGVVYITSDQLVVGSAQPTGKLIAVHPPAPPQATMELPGADMPPLGSMLTREGISGQVVQIDAVKRTARIRTAEGEERTVDWPPSTPL
jgi:hypothetical protein